MTNNRFMSKVKDLEYNDDGKPLCRWCKNIVNPPRRTMCSAECVHEMLIRKSGRYIRDCVFQRDNGICSICSIDTKDIAKTTLSLEGTERIEFLKIYNISLKRKIWKRKHGGGLWDADHIIPVKEGGGECGLDNYRTLCIQCHKKVTKDSYKKN